MMPDIICLGELLIDFISIDRNTSLRDSSGFLKAPGGAPANVAVGTVKLGACAGFIGKVGTDPFGDYLKKVLDDCGVDTKYLAFDKEARTTLSYVALKSNGNRGCMFYRNPGADMMLCEDEIHEDYFASANIFHFGSISLGSPLSEKATIRAIEYAKQHGLLISYDPNLRLSLWNNQEEAKHKINSGFDYADFVKISEEESEFITGTNTPEETVEYILNKGCRLVVVTLGEKGCYFSNGNESGYLKGEKVTTIETTGSGDAFVSAMLYQFNQEIKQGIIDPLSDLNDIKELLTFANKAGALATTKMGAIPSLPTKEEVQQFK